MIEIYQKVIDILINGGVKLTKWITSDVKVKSHIPKTDRSKKVVRTFEAEPQLSSILGYNWKVNTDSLIVCRGTEQEVPAKMPRRILIVCLNIVRPAWDMFTFHDKGAVSTQNHLVSNGTCMGQRIVSRTL